MTLSKLKMPRGRWRRGLQVVSLMVAGFALYVNDVHGQPTTINEAAGTPQAPTTTITYLSNYHLPSQIVTPGLTAEGRPVFRHRSVPLRCQR